MIPGSSKARRSAALRVAAVAAAIVTLLPLLGLTELSLERRRLAGRAEPGGRYYVPPAPLLRAICFGYRELAADLVWVRTIAYYADQLLGPRDYRHLASYVDTVLALDDSFREVYRYAPALFVLRGQHQANQDLLTAIRILERGHRHYPDDFHFPFMIGSTYMDLRGTASQRAAWRRKAATWLHRAALIGSDMPWLPSLVAKLDTQQGQRELAIKRLQELYLTSQDPEMKRQIALRLQTMQDEQLAHELREQGEEFARRHRQSDISYVPADLFVQIGLNPLEPFSLERYRPQPAPDPEPGPQPGPQSQPGPLRQR